MPTVPTCTPIDCESCGGDPIIHALAHSLHEKTHCTKGNVLFREGQTAKGVYLLCRGEARLTLTIRDGSEALHKVVGTGYLLGLPSCLRGEKYLLTAEMMTDGEVTFIERAKLLELLREHGDLCFQVVQIMGNDMMELPKLERRPPKAEKSKSKR